MSKQITFESLYYNIETDYINPHRVNIESSDDYITNFDSWHNMKNMSVLECFPIEELEQLQEERNSMIKWCDIVPCDMIVLVIDYMRKHVKEEVKKRG